MHALKFTAKIKNGIIEVPEEYRAQLSDLVSVVLINTSHESTADMIDQLLTAPLQTTAFKPMRRNEAHDRRH